MKCAVGVDYAQVFRVKFEVYHVPRRNVSEAVQNRIYAETSTYRRKVVFAMVGGSSHGSRLKMSSSFQRQRSNGGVQTDKYNKLVDPRQHVRTHVARYARYMIKLSAAQSVMW